jgi:hypothetical protein
MNFPIDWAPAVFPFSNRRYEFMGFMVQNTIVGRMGKRKRWGEWALRDVDRLRDG